MTAKEIFDQAVFLSASLLGGHIKDKTERKNAKYALRHLEKMYEVATGKKFQPW